VLEGSDRPPVEGQAVSVVVPTYREAENIPSLIQRVKATAATHRLAIELVIVDDGSNDGIEHVPARLGETSWVRVVSRRGPRDLSRAVVEGLYASTGDALVVMDADLSHPPELIPHLLAALARPGVDFALASRYVPGGSTYAAWGAARRLTSWVARGLARSLVAVEDPTSGFFALRRATVLAARPLDPIGYKIALELMVKCGCNSVCEVPFHFGERLYGKSKLGVREEIKYLRHLARLLVYRYGGAAPLLASAAAEAVPADLRRP
jgi:dolichol-phosphate mannosyltransferase